MSALLREWGSRFKTQLNRQSIVSASRWAEEYRMMSGDLGGPWRFDHFPWLRDMHDSQAPFNVGQKGAQLGFSENMLNVTFFQMDMMKRDVLYILPNTRPDAADFSASRFDKAVELSPHLKSMFSDVNNVGHKRAGSTNLFIRGANSRSGLKSIPAAVLIFDEFDEMDESKVSLAEERASGQKFTLDWKISTPTVPEFGINALFESSTKEHFYFPCPHCNKHIKLTFPDNLVITGDDANDPNIERTHIICGECKGTLHHDNKHEFISKGIWVPENKGSLTRGFYVNQLYSATLQPFKIARLFLKSIRDPHAEQEFYNSKMGLAHTVAGAKITDEMLHDIIKGYSMQEGCRSGYCVTMGIDVGRVFHCHIDAWDLTKCNPIDINADAQCQTLWAGELKDFSEAAKKMTEFQVKFCVVDSQPETQLATEFALRFPGRVRLCRYNSNIAARSLVTSKDGLENDIYVQVARTSWMDQALGRYRNKTIILPNNLPKDYTAHIKAPVRVPKKDSDGNPVYRYETPGSRPDHYAHARVYSEIALPFAVGDNKYITIGKEV